MTDVWSTSQDGSLAHSLHELNHPLTAILIDAEAAMLWLARDPADCAEARQAVERILGNCQRLAEAIASAREVVLFSLAEAKLDLNETVRSVLDRMSGDLRRHGITVEADLTPTLAPVRGDHGELARVLANLIANGVEAMRSVGDRPRRLRISSQRDGDVGVVVAVADSGPGTAPEIVDRLFERPLLPGPRGRGLGLASCRSIVEAHGGRLWASPNAPNGSIFSFSIPGAMLA